jgi:hypothetical protein
MIQVEAAAAGQAHGRPGEAARVARVLRPAAHRAGAWVSTQARVRLPGVMLWPDVVVSAADVPVDGIVDGVPLVVVELTAAGLLRWAGIAGVVVWGIDQGAAVQLVDGAITRPERILTVPDAPWLALPVATLLHAVGLRPPALAAAQP